VALRSDGINNLTGLAFKKASLQVPLSKVSNLFSKLPNAAILGGNDAGEKNRFSYFCAEPLEILELQTCDTTPFEKIQKSLDKYRLDKAKLDGLPEGIFTCGWVGYFSYDLGRFVENINSYSHDDLKMPLVRLGFYDRVICFDHRQGVFWLIAVELAGDDCKAEKKIAYLEAILEKSRDEKSIELAEFAEEEQLVDGFQANMTREYYLKAFAKIIKHIYDGDVYQINFSQRFSSDFTAKAIDLYHWQNKFNPAPYSAYLDAGDFKIVSASPELFMQIEKQKIRTCPIKGTRRRSGDLKTDRRSRSELLECEKEKAELDMIIDLERNDLGRICRYGTIKVSQARQIENYSTVIHAVATIEGGIRKGTNFSQCLRALFPGGSITGAPKVSAMQIIEALEPTKRALYTGSIGYIGTDGNVCLNIAIRTIIINGRKAFAQTGGGIVADSDPRREWDETLTKAKALLNGIKAVNQNRL